MKTSIKDIRRRELARAALQTMKEEGVARTTVSRVAKHAGMSPGLVHHYFSNKEELLEITMRYTTDELRRAVGRRLEQAHGPYGRVVAILDGQIDSEMFEVSAAQAWLSYLGQVPFVPRYRALQRVLYRRLRSNLIHELQALVPRSDAKLIAERLSMLIDGIWVRLAVEESGISHGQARDWIVDCLDREIAAISVESPAFSGGA